MLVPCCPYCGSGTKPWLASPWLLSIFAFPKRFSSFSLQTIQNLDSSLAFFFLLSLLLISNSTLPLLHFLTTTFSALTMQLPIDAITSRLGDRFNSVRSQSFSSRFANLRPVSEFLDLKRLSKPANFGEVQGRVNYNLSYFSSNYAAVFVMLSIYSLLTNPLLLFVILLVTGGLYGIGKLEGRDLDVQVARFNTSQLYTGLLVLAVPLGIWASPISTVLWLIGATGVTVFGHAALLDKPIENAFSEEAV